MININRSATSIAFTTFHADHFIVKFFSTEHAFDIAGMHVSVDYCIRLRIALATRRQIDLHSSACHYDAIDDPLF